MAGAPEGNENASAKNRLFSAAVKRVAAQNDGKKARAIAEKLVEMAEAGDIAAIKEFGDRTDGKAVQAIANDGDTPLVLQIIRLADANDPTP